ncbi:LOW QUALITY PROTEIN: BURP domain-containing protein 6-like [Asparagus officinalis]|uniref:LOW QUALITY PROTEIN: BURP domain-containing protein 6-like n=1 Tax=Asparagus officinalis TaxID=4686 RepID=UPI00098DE65B|nr:LOW QUALITY PROTEIN: BURP domain-containing protein 6-like [Asparagus officinalis]
MTSFFLLLSFLVVVAASHESLTAQVYWNKALPKTLVPGAIKDFLHPVKIEGHHASSSFGYRPVLEEDMLSGTKVKMHFMRTTAGSGATFLSRQAATTIPFSSASLPAILTHFSVNPNSVTASHSRKPYTSAEKPAIAEENKYCATSLESMVEYATSTLGTRHVSALSTVMSKEGAPDQEYVLSRVKKMSGSNFVACHARKYPYAVFYCHTVQGITAYQVSMVGEDGTTVEAVAACHTVFLFCSFGQYKGKLCPFKFLQSFIISLFGFNK